MGISWREIKLRLQYSSKKDVYINFSLFLSVFLVAAAVYDLINYTITERTDFTTQSFTFALLVCHTVGFYFSLLGFVYTTQADENRKPKRALSALGCSFIGFLLRLIIETTYIKYRPESYINFTDSGK